MEAEQGDVLVELDRLGVEIEELRACRRRLVVAADADRRTIERDLHDGVHQHLVALAVSLQLAVQATASDPAALHALLEDMGRDVQQALDQTALLAQRIYPATLGEGDLGTLLRSVALTAGIGAAVDVAVGPNCPPEAGMTIYLCWLDAAAGGSGETRTTITVREDEDRVAFEVVGNWARGSLDRVRDRVDAFGGRLTVSAAAGGRTCCSGSLPLSR